MTITYDSATPRSPRQGHSFTYVALVEVARDGGRFVLLATGNHTSFDGLPLHGKMQFLVYDLAARAPVLVAPYLSTNGDVLEALSPTGKKFLTFDGRSIRLYDVP